MKKLTMIFMIVFTFIVSCGNDSSSPEKTQVDKIAEAKAFKEAVKYKTAEVLVDTVTGATKSDNVLIKFSDDGAKVLTKETTDKTAGSKYLNRNWTLKEVTSSTEAVYANDDRVSFTKTFKIEGNNISMSYYRVDEPRDLGTLENKTETVNAKAFIDLVDGNKATDADDKVYIFNKKTLGISNGLAFVIYEAMSGTKALYISPSGKSWIVVEVSGKKLKATAVKAGMELMGNGKKEVLVAMLVEIGELVDKDTEPETPPTQAELDTAFKTAASSKSFKDKIGKMPFDATLNISGDGSTMTVKVLTATDNHVFVKAISAKEGLYTCADPSMSAGKYLRINVDGDGSITGNGETESAALN